MKASVTIEATFIYPVITFFTMLLILYAFYCHDRLTIKSNGYSALLTHSFKERESFDTNILSEVLKEDCIFQKIRPITYDETNFTLTIGDIYGSPISLSFCPQDKCAFLRRLICAKQVINSNEKDGN